MEQIEEAIKRYEIYAKENGFSLNQDRKVVERIVRGLLEREEKFGKRYCPCRRVSGKQEEDRKIICPCFWHREELEESGHCLCGLFEK
jgi:ferredoxin-thioredoxin reductase catalytic chain